MAKSRQDINKAYYAKNKDKSNAVSKAYYQAHADTIKPKAAVRSAEWGKKNRARKTNRDMEKYRNDPEYKARVQQQNLEYRTRTKILVMTHYSCGEPRCKCCGESELEFLTMDHIDGGGNEHRKVIRNIYRYLKNNNFPPGFQVLCMNCNFSKHLGGGICIHKRRNEQT